MARFTIFKYDKPGKGVPKNAPAKTGTALYFDILLRRFWKFIVLNLMYMVASLPAALIAWFISFNFVTWSATLANINPEAFAGQIIILAILVGVVLLLICGSGPATAAMFYVLRKYALDTHAWVASDFFDSFKINFKQGMIAYLINILTVSSLLFAFNFYSYSFSGITALLFKSALILTAVLFIFIQYYAYFLIAGYKMKLRHIYKSAVLMSLAHFGLNVAVLCVSGLIVSIGIFLMAGLSLAGFIFMGLLMFSLVSFTQIFMTDKAVKKALGDPSFKDDSEDYEKDDMFE